jgi:diadenosine tetraphosphate (Ap4A) HIT family hydrolase
MTPPPEPAPPCPFCAPDAQRVAFEDELSRALWDAFPVSKGHLLLVPRRHVASWFDATDAERLALLQATDRAKALVDATHHPDGYNLGVNVGKAAGQTVFHLHIHLIPRYAGDVPDPRGGVRHLIPGKGHY